MITIIKALTRMDVVVFNIITIQCIVQLSVSLFCATVTEECNNLCIRDV